MKIASLALALAALSPALSIAQQSATPLTGLYIGANVGRSHVDIDKSDIDQVVFDSFASVGFLASGVSSLDQNGTAFSLAIGYKIIPYLAVEASYLDLGKISYRAAGVIEDGVNAFQATVGLDVKSRGPTLALVGILPINPSWSLDVRAGAYRGHTTASAFVNAGGLSGSDERSTNNTSFLWGVGAAFAVNERWSVRLDFERINNVGGADTSDVGNVNLATAGVRLAF